MINNIKIIIALIVDAIIANYAIMYFSIIILLCLCFSFPVFVYIVFYLCGQIITIFYIKQLYIKMYKNLNIKINTHYENIHQILIKQNKENTYILNMQKKFFNSIINPKDHNN